MNHQNIEITEKVKLLEEACEKEKKMNYRKLILISFILFLILSPILFVYNKYKIQQQIGKEECEKRGFIYIETSFENKKETIFCDIKHLDDPAKLIKIDDKWERIS